MIPNNSSSGEKSGFGIWGKKSLIPSIPTSNANVGRSYNQQGSEQSNIDQSYQKMNRPNQMPRYQNPSQGNWQGNIDRNQGNQVYSHPNKFSNQNQTNFPQERRTQYPNPNYQNYSNPSILNEPRAMTPKTPIYQNPQFLNMRKVAYTPPNTNPRLGNQDYQVPQGQNEIPKFKGKWANKNNIQGEKFNNSNIRNEEMQDYEQDQAQSEHSYRAFHPNQYPNQNKQLNVNPNPQPREYFPQNQVRMPKIKQFNRKQNNLPNESELEMEGEYDIQDVMPKENKKFESNHKFQKKEPDYINLEEDMGNQYEGQEQELNQKGNKNKFKKKVKLSKNSISTREDDKGANRLEKKESREPKPKIDMGKVKELELKRKIVKDIEEKERNRSTSPLSVNMIRTNENKSESQFAKKSRKAN